MIAGRDQCQFPFVNDGKRPGGGAKRSATVRIKIITDHGAHRIVTTRQQLEFQVQNISLAVIADDCVFPFEYHGRTYRRCTYANHDRPWCAWDNPYQSRRWSNCGKEQSNLS